MNYNNISNRLLYYTIVNVSLFRKLLITDEFIKLILYFIYTNVTYYFTKLLINN